MSATVTSALAARVASGTTQPDTAQQLAAARLDAIALEAEAAPGEALVGRKDAEHDQCVGHGRLRAAAAIAGRPWIGAGAFRPGLQRAAAIDKDAETEAVALLPALVVVFPAPRECTAARSG